MPKGQPTTDEQIKMIEIGKRAGLANDVIAQVAGVSSKTVGTYTPAEYIRGGAKYVYPGNAAEITPRCSSTPARSCTTGTTSWSPRRTARRSRR